MQARDYPVSSDSTLNTKTFMNELHGFVAIFPGFSGV
jgi:hypothetical protein